jgi:alpha-galactosidase
MAAVANEIHAEGLKAGIWLAPFIAGERSRLYAEHPDWFVRSAFGEGHAEAIQNWGQICYALDLTNPEVIEWLHLVFRTICDDWDYDYVKIDFIFAGAIDGKRRDLNVTRAQATAGVWRRSATQSVTASFACGNPQGRASASSTAPGWDRRRAVLKPFDRRQPDFILSDPAAINSIRNSIDRYWMHNRLWTNDPDCLLVRDSRRRFRATSANLATVIGMTGGMVLSSDNLAKVTPERQRIISLLLPAYGKAATPVDLFRSGEVPGILELDCGTHRLVALFNWDDGEAMVAAELPPGEWHAFEFWEREYLGVVSGRVELVSHGRACRLIRLTPVRDHPQIVGSTLHIAQGALEIESEVVTGESIRITLCPVACGDGSIYVWRGGAVVRFRYEACERRARSLTR